MDIKFYKKNGGVCGCKQLWEEISLFEQTLIGDFKQKKVFVLRKKYCTQQRLNSTNNNQLPCSKGLFGIRLFC